MKRLLIIVMMCVCTQVFAQINIKVGNVPPKTIVTVSTLSGNFSIIQKDTMGFFLRADSSNRYDDYYLIYLGETKVQVDSSLTDIKGLYGLPYKQKVDIPIYKDLDGHYNAYTSEGTGRGFIDLTIYGKGYAGCCWISNKKWDKLITLWNKYNGKK